MAGRAVFSLVARALLAVAALLSGSWAWAVHTPWAINFSQNNLIYQNCKGAGYNYGNLRVSLLPAGNEWITFDEVMSGACKEARGSYCPVGQEGKKYPGGKWIVCVDPAVGCPAGQRSEGGVCAPNPDYCSDLRDSFIERTVQIGWARFYSGGGGSVPLEGGGTVTVIGSPAKAPGRICSGGCSMQMIQGGKGYWVNVAGASGNGSTVPWLFGSNYQYTGADCDEGEPDTNMDVAGPKPPDAPLGGAPADQGGTPGDGGAGDPGTTSDPGDKPGTSGSGQGGGAGEGSGEGSAAGSGAGAGKGGGIGGGIGNDNNAERLCGVGDLPPCNTLIDESGTPSDGGDRMSTEDLNHEMTKLDNALSSIYDRGDKDTSWGVVPSWFGSADCSPWNFGEFIGGISLTVDYCPAVPYAKGAASFMWLVATFFAVLAMVFRSVGGAS